ncbi:hypothetical protein C0992_007757 [Termitomyces sp. T32_za158]|nr:hypothetical protein C0992_007757 [Termitomyces sp. T32_za158]
MVDGFSAILLNSDLCNVECPAKSSPTTNARTSGAGIEGRIGSLEMLALRDDKRGVVSEESPLACRKRTREAIAAAGFVSASTPTSSCGSGTGSALEPILVMNVSISTAFSMSQTSTRFV